MKKVGIIAPSGSVEKLSQSSIHAFFNSFSVEVKIFPSCYSKFRYMAGSDSKRLDDIHNAFEDNSIDTIICLRGGYGALRLIDDIDYKLIENNKKPFVGFSDVTILLAAFYKFAHLQSFHGKMAANGVINMDKAEFESYVNSIKFPQTFKTSLTGGVLWGGNLSSLVSTFGAKRDIIPDENIILFLEDINEPDYKIDKMLTQILRNESLTSKIKGVIFGEFTGAGKYLDEIQKEFITKLNVPSEKNLNITHGENNMIVPFGFCV